MSATPETVTLTPGQLATVLDALADAESYRSRQAAEPCHDCDEARGGPHCIVHRADDQAARAYGDLAAQLLGGSTR